MDCVLKSYCWLFGSPPRIVKHRLEPRPEQEYMPEELYSHALSRGFAPIKMPYYTNIETNKEDIYNCGPMIVEMLKEHPALLLCRRTVNSRYHCLGCMQGKIYDSTNEALTTLANVPFHYTIVEVVIFLATTTNMEVPRGEWVK